MWMADPHVISALREKRALVAGLIEKLERKLEQHRADLTHIDGVRWQCCGHSENKARSNRLDWGAACDGKLPQFQRLLEIQDEGSGVASRSLYVHVPVGAVADAIPDLVYRVNGSALA